MTETRKKSAPKRGADAATSARAILTAEKINRAAELRLAGLTLEEIGKELGCSKVYAHRRIKRGRDMVATKNVETLREREAAILEEARERVEEDALVNLSLQHFDRYLKVSDRVRALYGLDAPVKSQVELNANVKLQTLAEWRAELADVFRRHDAADQSEGAFKVDVKTARKAYNLIVEVGHVIPLAIYVLAQYHDKTDTANLLGWEWGANLLKTAPRDFGKGVLNHHIHRSRLRSIDELLDHCMH